MKKKTIFIYLFAVLVFSFSLTCFNEMKKVFVIFAL